MNDELVVREHEKFRIGQWLVENKNEEGVASFLHFLLRKIDQHN